jgi:hypothetical protein
MAVFDLTEVMRSLPSVYQLLPRYPVVQTSTSATPVRVSELVGVPGFDPEGMRAHVELHRELDVAWEYHKDDPKYLKNGYITIPVVGARQPTRLSATWDGQVLTTAAGTDGDGTVPRVSAIPLPQSDPKDFQGYFVGEQHGALQNHTFVLGDLIERLRLLLGPDLSNLRGGSSARLLRALSLAVDDLYAPGEPVVLRAQAYEGTKETLPTMSARIEPVNGGVEQTVALEPAADGWAEQTVTGLAPGLYRVRLAASGDDAFAYAPVHSLFEVASSGGAL